MRLKLDENVPADAAVELAKLGHDAETSVQEGLGGESDDVIWKVAQAEGRFLVTQDLDFSDVIRFQPGRHHGILVLRLRSASRRAIIERIIALARSETMEEWNRCTVVATERKIRVRRPPT